MEEGVIPKGSAQRGSPKTPIKASFATQVSRKGRLGVSPVLVPNNTALDSPIFTVKVSTWGTHSGERGENWRKPRPGREGRALLSGHSRGLPVLWMALSSLLSPPRLLLKSPRVHRSVSQAYMHIARGQLLSLEPNPTPSTLKRCLWSFPLVPGANLSRI